MLDVIQAAAVDPVGSLPQMATVIGIVSTVVLLAGNMLFAGVFIGRITTMIKAQSTLQANHSTEMEKLAALLLDHESRISNMEGRSYGRRKDDG